MFSANSSDVHGRLVSTLAVSDAGGTLRCTADVHGRPLLSTNDSGVGNCTAVQ